MTNEIRLLIELNASHYSLREGRRSLCRVSCGERDYSCKRSGVRVGREKEVTQKERKGALRMSEEVSKIVAEKKWRESRFIILSEG